MATVREAWTDERLDDLSDRMDRGFEKVDRRFEQVDRRFEQIDNRFDALHRTMMTMMASMRLGFLGVIASFIATQL